MKSAIELLVQDCNYAVGQKNKAETELAALRERIADAPSVRASSVDADDDTGIQCCIRSVPVPAGWSGKRVLLVKVDE